MTETPERIVQSYFEGVNGFREGRDPFSRFAPDFLYTIIGTTPVSGTYRGAEELLLGVGPFLDRLTSLRIEPRETFVAGDHVFVLAKGEGESQSGQPYHNQYCYVFRLRNGSIVEVQEFLDTALVETAVFGKALVSDPEK